MIGRLTKWSVIPVALIVARPLEAADGHTLMRPGPRSHLDEEVFGSGGAPLFDSVDQDFNPVSMADMIAGRPLVLAVSSCT